MVIALGSNLGDSEAILREAIRRLAEKAVGPVKQSSFWRSAPVDCPPGSPPFLNAAVMMSVGAAESPESVLDWLQHLEREFGRRPKTVLNEPRPLDLDLIDWQGERRLSPRLTLPHPRAMVRPFVLEPLAEIAPDRILAGQSRSVSEILREMTPDDSMVRLES